MVVDKEIIAKICHLIRELKERVTSLVGWLVTVKQDFKQQKFMSHKRHLIPGGNWVEDGILGAKIKVKLLWKHNTFSTGKMG